MVIAAAVGLGVPGAATAAPRFAPATTATITPGALMITPLDRRIASACTAAFVFAGPSGVYLGYSAHCAGSGGSMGLSGCVEPTLPLGSLVVIERRDGEWTRGRLAYSSWRTMQERGETDEALCFLNDFALVELDPSDVDAVNPSVPVLGGPTGLDTDGSDRGEVVFSYQPWGGDPAVKQGNSLGDFHRGLTHRVTTVPAGNPGDSGSGYLDAGGEALGVLSTQFLDSRRTNGVTDLAIALSYANRFGGLGEVALVPGTERFAAS